MTPQVTNPKTTYAGYAILVFVGLYVLMQAIHNCLSLDDLKIIVPMIIGGSGLISAADGGH